MKIYKLTHCTFLVYNLFAHSFFAEAKVKTLEVGVIFHQGGPGVSNLGVRQELRMGVERAKKLFEKKHRNVKVQLYHYSHEESVDTINQGVEKIYKKGHPAVIGGGASRFALPLSEALEKRKLVFITPVASHPKVTENKRMVNKISREFFQLSMGEQKLPPSQYEAIGFDTAWVLFVAMHRSKDPKNPNQIVQELKKIKDVPLVTAESFRFAANHSPAKNLHIYKVSKKGVEAE